MFKRPFVLSLTVALTAALMWLPGGPARAANSPTFRDCSFITEGVDADFVQLFGAKVTPGGALQVSPSQNSLEIEASESSDPGDSTGHDTLTVTVSAPDVPTQTVSGDGIGKIFMTVPLIGSGTGRVYTIAWAAVFDNGNRPCPNAMTPDNTGPNPFVVTVSH